MNKTIGDMIVELENDVEACRKADDIIGRFKALYKMAKPSHRYKLMHDMLVSLGWSTEEADKMIKNA